MLQIRSFSDNRFFLYNHSQPIPISYRGESLALQLNQSSFTWRSSFQLCLYDIPLSEKGQEELFPRAMDGVCEKKHPFIWMLFLYQVTYLFTDHSSRKHAKDTTNITISAEKLRSQLNISLTKSITFYRQQSPLCVGSGGSLLHFCVLRSQIPQALWLPQRSFSHNSGGQKFKIKASAGFILLRPFSSARRRHLPPVSSHGLPSICVCVLLSASSVENGLILL